MSGLGEHSASCIAFNNAVDENGVHGVSATQTWSLKIGAPTELGVSFAKYVGLRCTKVKERKKIPGHWVTRHRHGKTVKVKTKPRHKIVKVTKCHPKTKRVRVVVRVPLKRHGKVVKRHGRVVYRKKIKHKRVPVTPHWKSKTVEHVKHGHATTVNGWLGSDRRDRAGRHVGAGPHRAGQRAWSVHGVGDGHHCRRTAPGQRRSRLAHRGWSKPPTPARRRPKRPPPVRSSCWFRPRPNLTR